MVVFLRHRSAPHKRDFGHTHRRPTTTRPKRAEIDFYAYSMACTVHRVAVGRQLLSHCGRLMKISPESPFHHRSCNSYYNFSPPCYINPSNRSCVPTQANPYPPFLILATTFINPFTYSSHHIEPHHIVRPHLFFMNFLSYLVVVASKINHIV